MDKFNFQLFCSKLAHNTNIESINLFPTNKDLVVVTFKDAIVLYICVGSDVLHKFYTFMNSDYPEYFYYGKMPHDNYTDLYNEINRMSSAQTRRISCKTPYFKCVF